jgi:hypothetical protein
MGVGGSVGVLTSAGPMARRPRLVAPDDPTGRRMKASVH